MTDKVQKIKEWIDKEQDGLMDANGNFEHPEHEGTYHILCNLDTYIDSMQEEPKFKTGDRIKPIDSCLGSPRTIVDICDSWYVTDQGTLDFEYEDNWELIEEPVSEDLEKAAEVDFIGHCENHIFGMEFHKLDMISAFKAGAKWQEKKDQSTIELAEDHAMLAGMEKMKEQMMKDAVDMVVGYWMPNGLMLATDETENCYNIDDGDRVKVIVIKED